MRYMNKWMRLCLRCVANAAGHVCITYTSYVRDMLWQACLTSRECVYFDFTVR